VTAGLAVPTSWAGEVAHRLWSHGIPVPVLTLPEAPHQWVFLAEPGDRPCRTPPGVRYLAEPLTSPDLRWITPPDGVAKPPTLGAVLCAIRAAWPLDSW
jgi:hypothetical protein